MKNNDELYVNLNELITDKEQLKKMLQNVDMFISRFHECKTKVLSSAEEDLEDDLERLFKGLITFRGALNGKIIHSEKVISFSSHITEACFFFYEADIRINNEETRMQAYRDYRKIEDLMYVIFKLVSKAFNEHNTGD